MSSSVWPLDTFLEPREPRDDTWPRDLNCFVISPFRPKKRWLQVFELVKSVADQVGKQWGLTINTRRADEPSAGIIHPEIWKQIYSADVLVCDVTGQNPNVMLELGVSSAKRRKEHVIIIRDGEDPTTYSFDINPARYLEYEYPFDHPDNVREFVNNLGKVITEALVGIPYPEPVPKNITLPFEASLDRADERNLLSLDLTHRRMIEDSLEFGSPVFYSHSWLRLGDLKEPNIRVKAKMKMTLRGKDPFIGIMVRAQNHFANWGHLVLIREDGRVLLTLPEGEGIKNSPDKELFKLKEFDANKFTDLKVEISENNLNVNANGSSTTVPLSSLPHVFSNGLIYFNAGYCRAGIKNIRVEKI